MRIAHDAEIEFQLIDGRFHFEGVRAGFPDLDPRLEMISRGSVGLDQTLDIDLEIPRLDATKHKERGPVRCHLTGTVSNPQLSAKDASLVVRLPDRSEPLVDIDGVDLVLRVDKQEGRPVIAVDPVQLLTREKISRQLGTGLLHLVDPELQYSPDLVGELSLSVDTMRIPVGGPDAQWLADLEVRGQMTIHQLSSLTQSPLRVALAKLLADLYSIRPGESVRVVHDAEIDFGLYQSRFHFQGLQFGFPDIDPKLQVHVDGSIGLDQTLDLHLQLPRLDATKRQQKGLVECHITGTVAHPELAVTDASLVVRLPEHEQPLLDVDGVDLKMEIRYQDDVPVLELAPVNLFDHRRLESQRGEEWLRLLVPALADVADVEGEFSLSIDSMHVPLSGSKQQLLRSTELNGQLQLHEVTTTVGTPLLTAMVKVLADQYGKSPSQTVRVAKDCEVHFQLREGRLFQEGLRIGLPEFSPDLVCRVGGSVGVDRSLDLVLQVPAALAGTATGQSGDVRFTVTGTLDNPTVAQADK
ncbi:hypothetical protein FYK55_25170 [Roseiconus nitratireducens]|uniref:DUF3971 domain-containing protein n=1 Tax=Roseiconus nitratireducens TaxID=2605748 RepID=A0A5M6CVG2_9BACT|nr:hypothetical protein [Roseiconus nitratireducens]KAA5539214.1 hypothetical protein FYK55_25170 [Roseiconus nitratireducens]